MKEILKYPFDSLDILRKHKSIKRQLIESTNLINKKVFVASGTTSDEVIKILEIFLLASGIRADILQGDYGVFYEDLAFENKQLAEFNPDIIYVHSSFKNIINAPEIGDDVELFYKKVDCEYERLKEIWTNVETNYKCQIIQNNFELPPARPLGNIESYHHNGMINFINNLNLKISNYAAQNENLYINDINYLSAWHGIENWFSYNDWYRSKHSVSIKYIPYLAHNLSNIINAIFGKSKKALVLDLDNTLWGGVIGDEGISGIKVGSNSPTSEAYLDFQKYVKKLHDRGVMLSVASKNDLSNALEGINYEEGCLNEKDFISIKANWENKSDNIEEIARELNVLADSLVFIDDNPAEREAVRRFLPEVVVPEMTNDISDYIDIVDKSGFFEILNISKDDLIRNSSLRANKQRVKYEKKAKNYDEYLSSLDMKAKIIISKGDNLERISQLINKTNQFNLTAIRYTSSEVENFMQSKNKLVIYGSLEDKFGNNGIVSVMVCTVTSEIKIDNWVMSCRVFKRHMEYAMMDKLIEISKEINIHRLKGVYIPTQKNQFVKNLYEDLGFKLIAQPSQTSETFIHELDLKDYIMLNKTIEVVNE